MLADDQASATDDYLVNSCRQGNQDSFRHLYRRYQAKVRATLYRMCGDAMLDDLVQEVFLRAWKALPKLRQPRFFSTWLYRISWNVATDQRRELAKLRLQGEGCEEKEQFPQETPWESQGQKNPGNSDLLQLHYQDLVYRSLQALPWEQRIVLILHDLEDLPQKEVAQVLRIPLGTVKSRLFHARNNVREFLRQQGVSL